MSYTSCDATAQRVASRFNHTIRYDEPANQLCPGVWSSEHTAYNDADTMTVYVPTKNIRLQLADVSTSCRCLPLAWEGLWGSVWRGHEKTRGDFHPEQGPEETEELSGNDVDRGEKLRKTRSESHPPDSQTAKRVDGVHEASAHVEAAGQNVWPPRAEEQRSGLV